MPETHDSTGDPGANGANPAPENQPKTKNQLKNDAKRAAKLAKFQAKQAKLKDSDAASNSSGASAKPAKKEAKKDEAVQEERYVDETPKPGMKKVLSKEIQKSYQPQYVESSWEAWWSESGCNKPVPVKDSLRKQSYVIPIPPPNVTGKLHIGHAMGNAIQDCLIRFKRMQGYSTLFIGGCDHAGIATQSVVEKTIWRQSKQTRHDLGREQFIKKVWEWRKDYGEHIYMQLKRMGGAYDWNRPKFTMDPELVHAVKVAFKAMHERGLIYRDNKLVNWCCKLNTALSNLEVENRDLTGRTMMKVPGHEGTYEFGVLVEFAYPIEGTDEKLVVATTRIETMLGDSGIAVHPKDDRYKHLVGKHATHPFISGRRLLIVADDYVDMEFGTGAVKLTPAHDFNDYELGKRHGLPFINILNENGTLNDDAGPEFSGMMRFDARTKVVEMLKTKGLYVGTKDNVMTIPICSRSGDVIEPFLKPQWYVSCDSMAQKAKEVVRKGDLVIQPQTSEKEWFRWLDGIRDWCISRQLWWGHRIPAYFVRIEGRECRDEDQTHWVIAMSDEEAERLATERFPDVPRSKMQIQQDPDVLDTWFSSGLWPFSTVGWPDTESSDYKQFYPMSILETCWDILFFWVARMVMMGLELTGKSPFAKVFCHAMIRDAHGRKMSKSLGNVVDPVDVINGITLEELGKKLENGNLPEAELKKAKAGQKRDYPNGIPECGSDAVRFSLCAYTSGGRDLNLNILRVEGYRKFCNKLWNAIRFSLITLEGLNKQTGAKFSAGMREGNMEGDLSASRNVEIDCNSSMSLVERWILARLNATISEVTDLIEGLNFMGSTTTLHNFWLYDLCGVYIEASKILLKDAGAAEADRVRHVLFICMDQGLKLLHPYMPYLTEELWQRLHLCSDVPYEEMGSLSAQKWPRPMNVGTELESKKFGMVNDSMKVIRSMLADYMIRGKTDVYFLCVDDTTADVIQSQRTVIAGLCGKELSGVFVARQASDLPAGCAMNNINDKLSVFLLVKGHADVEAELKKINIKLDRVNTSIATLQKQMEMDGYETKVKESVRIQNRDKLATLQEERQLLEKSQKNFHSLQD